MGSEMCIRDSGRITRAMVEDEIETLTITWQSAASDPDLQTVEAVMGPSAHALDPFDVVQLALVIRTCAASASLSDAGRALFCKSRQTRTSRNDSDRLRKYLAKYDLSWDDVGTS